MILVYSSGSYRIVLCLGIGIFLCRLWFSVVLMRWRGLVIFLGCYGFF